MPTFFSSPPQLKKLFLSAAMAAFGVSLQLGVVQLSLAQSSAQITITPQQMQRSGVKLEAAVLASDGKLAPNANLSEKGLRLSGTVVAATSATHLLSSVVSGVVQSIHVQPLQTVKAGTPIATLFSQQLMEMQREYLQLATQAQLTADKAQRDEGLFKEGIIAMSRVQDSRAQAVQAQVAASERYQSLRSAGLSDAAIKVMLRSKSMSSTLTIQAKNKGTVVELNAQLGQRIEAGMALAKMSADAPLWIEFQASRAQLGQVRLGDILQIQNCASARVMAISPQMDGSNQSILIRAQEVQESKPEPKKTNQSASCLRLNQFVEATHLGHQVIKNSLGVPASAVVRNGAQNVVFVKNAQGFEVVEVKLVSGSPDKVWVTGNFNGAPQSTQQTMPQVATQGLIALKGIWLGLGEAAEEAAPTPTSAPASANKANSTNSTTSEKK